MSSVTWQLIATRRLYRTISSSALAKLLCVGCIQDPKMFKNRDIILRSQGPQGCGQGGHDVGVQAGRPDGYDVYVDSVWAGDRQQRQSTSGGLVIVGGTVAKSWSRTQRGRSLSSAEAEYYASVTGAAEALAVQALAEEMGWKMSVRVPSWFGETATHRVEVLMGPRIGTRPEDRDREDQWTRQPHRLSD